MSKIFFSFNTEDFVNSQGAEGILRSAHLLEKHGVQGCFQIVARLARRW